MKSVKRARKCQLPGCSAATTGAIIVEESRRLVIFQLCGEHLTAMQGELTFRQYDA